jgi:hypothetical protein
MSRVHIGVFSCFITLCASPLGGAAAQGAPPAHLDARAAAVGDRTLAVQTRWAADGTGSGRLIVEGRPPTTLYEGGGGAATIATGHGVWLVAYEVDAAREPFRARVVRRDGDGVTIGDEQRFARPGGRHDLPFAVAATPTPDGFSVFFQEIQEDDPTAAHTYLARLDPRGAGVGAPVEVPIPWSLAGAIWNGAGYHLALIYPGAMDGMRLSMVSTTAEGQPQQHPDWASAAGIVTDVHLAKSGARILAFYRGGSGERIFESDVTQIGNWGGEPPAATRHGAIGEGEAIVVRRDGERVRAESMRVR